MSAIGLTDNAINGLVQVIPESFRPVLEAATFWGGPGFTILFGVLVAAGLWAVRHNRDAIRMGFAIGATALPPLIKLIIDRTRPDTPYVALMNPFGTSFPSGHATDTALVFGLIAYFAVQKLRGPMAAAVIAACVLWIALVGVSRVWLGAHYPTDVLGGWVLAGSVLALIVLFRPKTIR